MATFKIPLVNIPQTFSITLNAVEYIMTCKWNESCGWILDISDASNNPLVFAIPLVTGLDILEPYSNVEWGGSLIVYTDGNALATPTLNNLGVESNLYFVTAD